MRRGSDESFRNLGCGKMNKILLQFFVCVFLAVGCVPAVALTQVVPPQSSITPTPTFTQIPSLTPTLTATVIPAFKPTMDIVPLTPLVSHEWKPAPILITYSQDSFGFCADVCPTDPPPFILYGDGTLIIQSPYNPDNGQWHYLYKKLNQGEICQLLNTVDEFGFFEFDPSTYSTEPISDSGNWNIKIHAWKNKEVSLYGLGDLVVGLKNDPVALSNAVKPPSVLNTFISLYGYPTNNLEAYIPSVLGIWLWKTSQDLPGSKEWTLTNPGLAELYKKVGSPNDKLANPVILNGEIAKNVYALFDNSNYYGLVTEGSEQYGIYTRPILPFEKIAGEVSKISPTAKQMNLPKVLSCNASDGILPIPNLVAP